MAFLSRLPGRSTISGLDEFIASYGQEPRPGFTKAPVNAWRAELEARCLGSPSSPRVEPAVTGRWPPAPYQAAAPAFSQDGPEHRRRRRGSALPATE